MLSTSSSVGGVPSKKFVPITRPRKPLQVLQKSAADETVLVSSPKMVVKRESHSSVSSTQLFTIPEDSIETKSTVMSVITTDPKKTPIPRRSARRNASNSQNIKLSKSDQPSTSKQTKRKTKKLKGMKPEKEQTISNMKQSTLDGVFVSREAKPNDSENIDLQNTTSHMKLAEQRKVALEETTYENAQHSSISSTQLFTIPEDSIETKSTGMSVITADKEKTPRLRRSARRNASNSQNVKLSKSDQPSTSEQTRKTKKLKGMKPEKEQTISKLKQSTLDDVFVSPEAKPNDSENTEDLQNNTSHVRCLRSADIPMDMLTCDTPSLEYLMKLAKQRKVAIEETTYENAQPNALLQF